MNRRLTTLAAQALAAVALASFVIAGCGAGEPEPAALAEASDAPDSTAASAPPVDDERRVGPPDGRPDVLSDWGQVGVTDGRLVLADGVVPYSLNSALFSDYAHKLRTVWLPEGADPATYDDEDSFDFPVGTVITKTFYYPTDDAGPGGETRVVRVAQPPESTPTSLDLDAVHLVETRILVHRDAGWEALPYVWNDDETEATLQRTGDLKRLTLVDADGETPFPYVVPNVNQCAGCHATNHTTKEIVPIGPKARHLNLDVDDGTGLTSQLDAWVDNGLLTGLPEVSARPMAAVWDDENSTLDERARAYLDVNCAHCHNRVGPADTSGLFLEASTEEGFRLGVCKPPIAAGTGTGGRLVGIRPGVPDESIFVYRMLTDDPGAMMPELGRAVIHAEGVELVSDWIASLEGGCS